MKKIAILVAFFCFVLTTVFALDALVSWNWYKNDRDVQFFRYQLDDQDDHNWTVVDGNVLEITLDVDVSVAHTLYLQQSYDGIHWSQSSYTGSEIYTSLDLGLDSDISYDFDENPIEEDVETTEVVEKMPEEESSVGQEKKTQNTAFLSFDFGYRNSIPNQKAPKNIGMVASYTQLFPYASKISDKFASGFRVALGFYAAKELFSKKWPFVNITNANYFVVSSIQATMNFAPSKGVFSISFGPEVQLAFGHSKPIFYAGLNALFQMRFNLSEKHSVGLSIGNHFYFYPQTLNLYDMRVSFSMVL